MLVGTVIGHATSSVKHASLRGAKLLVVQAYGSDGRTPDGEPVLAVDAVGAGLHEQVMLTSDGRYARDFLNADATPVRWTIIGIRDA